MGVEMQIAILGVLGTLGGTVLGWVLNNLSQRGKLNISSAQNDQTKMMNKIMIGMIIFMSLFMTAALDIYWLTSNIFTVFQNLLIKRSKKLNEKA
mgnify:CR=1 FL=1